MKSVNWLDILIVLPLVFGLVRGIMRGFITEIIGFVVVILGVVGSRMLAPQFSAWLLRQFAWPSEVCDIVAYMLLFLVIAVVLSIIAKLLNKLLHAVHLGWINRLLGGLVGLLKYAVIVLLAVFVTDTANRHFHWLDKSETVQTSVVYPYAVSVCSIIYQSVPTSATEKLPSVKL